MDIVEQVTKPILNSTRSPLPITLILKFHLDLGTKEELTLPQIPTPTGIGIIILILMTMVLISVFVTPITEPYTRPLGATATIIVTVTIGCIIIGNPAPATTAHDGAIITVSGIIHPDLLSHLYGGSAIFTLQILLLLLVRS
jgi:hypothetical protein